jgi:hypothetical protein
LAFYFLFSLGFVFSCPPPPPPPPARRRTRMWHTHAFHESTQPHSRTKRTQITRPPTQSLAPTHPPARTLTHTHNTHTHARARAHTHTHTHTCPLRNSPIHLPAHALICSLIHPPTCTCAHTHSYPGEHPNLDQYFIPGVQPPGTRISIGFYHPDVSASCVKSPPPLSTAAFMLPCGRVGRSHQSAV